MDELGGDKDGNVDAIEAAVQRSAHSYDGVAQAKVAS
jgi:hypothetical protein